MSDTFDDYKQRLVNLAQSNASVVALIEAEAGTLLRFASLFPTYSSLNPCPFGIQVRLDAALPVGLLILKNANGDIVKIFQLQDEEVFALDYKDGMP